jgi:hypothetical protein
MFESAPRPKKRLFLALVLCSLAILAGVAWLLWRLMQPGLHNISSYLPLIVGGCILLAAIFALAALFCMVLAVMGMPVFKTLQGFAWYLINFLFPLAVFFGKLAGIGKERIERSFIELSNHLFQQKKMLVSPERVLLLLPHCLQLDTCPHKITQNISNCQQCGGCCIGSLLGLCRKYGLNMAVVSGGTLARRVVMAMRPKVILAVACERDLTSGIQDVFPMPVFAVLNQRPYGPCCNTTVDLAVVEDAVRSLVGGGVAHAQAD